MFSVLFVHVLDDHEVQYGLSGTGYMLQACNAVFLVACAVDYGLQ